MDTNATNRGGPLFWLRRRSWRFWIVVVVLSMPVLYVGSFGPWCWAMSWWGPIDDTEMSCGIYEPLVRMWWDDSVSQPGRALGWYARLFADPMIDPGAVEGTRMILLESP